MSTYACGCVQNFTRARVAATLPSPKSWLVNKFQHIPLLTIPLPAGLDHRPKPKPHITKLRESRKPSLAWEEGPGVDS